MDDTFAELAELLHEWTGFYNQRKIRITKAAQLIEESDAFKSKCEALEPRIKELAAAALDTAPPAVTGGTPENPAP